MNTDVDVWQTAEDARAQYETYLELADLARMPTIGDLNRVTPVTPIASLGFTLERR